MRQNVTFFYLWLQPEFFTPMSVTSCPCVYGQPYSACCGCFINQPA